jgi:16S rRNA processing protein RimM
MQLVVGRIAKAHGTGGEVSVEVRTDDADARYAPGSRLDTDPAARGPLVVQSVRSHSGRLLVRFEGIADRTQAEGLRNTLLLVDSATSAEPDEDDVFWDHDLIGLVAETTSGMVIGPVCDVLHPPGPDLLAIARPDGGEALVPFVAEIVPTVDLPGKRVVVDPPEGLLDL